MAGELMGVLAGNGIMQFARNQQYQKDAIERKAQEEAFKRDLENRKLLEESDRTKRAYPTVIEQAQQLGNLTPTELENVLNLRHGNPLGILNYNLKKDEQERKIAEDLKKYTIPGYSRSGEVKPSDTELAKLRDTASTFDAFEKAIKDQKENVTKYGTMELFGPGSAKLSGADNAIRMQLKDLYKLGAITGPDMAILEQGLENPNSIKSFFTKDSTRQEQLSTLLENLKANAMAKLKTGGYTPENSEQGTDWKTMSTEDLMKIRNSMAKGQ